MHFQQSGRVPCIDMSGDAGMVRQLKLVFAQQKAQAAYCSSLRTVCWLVLAWASTAVAACCMICVRDSSVEAIA